jgi:protein-tyrosine phosphatase
LLVESDQRLRILFVCLGNICRSPTAEAATRAALIDAGLHDRVELDSAGIGDWHVGNPPDRRMHAAALAAGIELSGTARQVLSNELAAWDLVLAMDRNNYTRLRAMVADDEVRSRIRMFREFDRSADDADVPDPYYGNADGFAQVARICQAAARALVDVLADQLRAGAR